MAANRRPVTYNLAEAINLILRESDSELPLSSDESSEDDVSSESGDETDNVSPADEQSDEQDALDEDDEGPLMAQSTRGRGRGNSRGRARGRGRQQQPQPPGADGNMIGRNGKVWTTQPPAVGRRQLQDIIRNPPGITNDARKETMSEVFNLFVSNEILDIIVRETNREARRWHEAWNTNHPDNIKEWKAVTLQELKALIDILMYAGATRDRLEPMKELWSQKTGRPLFAATMSFNRYKSLMRFLRFDNKRTRENRRATDKLAAFRDVWQMFIANLPKYYLPGVDITVDEQLVAFRGRCAFRQYMPSKPAKYGLKIWWACNARTSFPLKGDVYLGR